MTWRHRRSVAVFVLAATGGIAYWFGHNEQPAAKKNGSAPVPVQVARAEVRDVAVVLELTGRVEAYESVDIRARVDGQVQTIEFSEGRHVRRGDVLVQLERSDFEARTRQAEAALARDQALLAKARTDLERTLSLKAKGFVADAGVDAARSTLAAAEASVAADQAALDLATLQLGYTTLRAPFDGRVGARLVFPGTSIKANDTVLALVNRVKPALVSFNVPEKYLPLIRSARGKVDTITISRPGVPATQAGALSFIDNAVDTTTGTIQAKARLANDDEALVPGQFVTVAMTVQTLSNAVTVPLGAVQQGPAESYIYVVKDDQTVELRNITVAARQQGIAAIAHGLSAGEAVVIDGQLRLVPGARIRPADEAPARP